MTRRKMVAGNWKMNGTRDSVNALLDGIHDGFADAADLDVLVCPPSTALAAAAAVHDSGAFTGEISGPMLREFGCEYCIVGHSERRAMYGDTNALVASKFAAAQSAGLVPILCVGETLEERQRDATEQVIADQLYAVIDHAGVGALEQAVVAYEPVWAIGTGQTATPEQAQAVHAFVRSRVAQHAPRIAEQLRILYGGSVNAGNAASLFAQADVDGGLIGGASLKAADFLAICAAAGAGS